MFAEIVEKLGTRVAISDVKIHFPKQVGHVMRKGERISRGVYDISLSKSSAQAKPKKAPIAVPAQDTSIEVIAKRDIDVIDNIADENLIPEVNPLYVPFGCYSIVLDVIRSDVFAPVYIIGDSGNGKTFGVEQACAKAKRELIIMNITNETTEEDLIGSYVLKDGNMIWRDGPVIVAMRRGAVLCLDEIDQARPAILALQTVAQGKPYFIKKTNELVKPMPGFTLIGTANTKGDGEGMDRFSGAQILNEAFIERFNIVVEQGYPSESVETKILRGYTSDEGLISRLTRFAKITRVAYADGAITHCVTTRRVVQIIQNISIFKDERKGLSLAMARFSTENQKMFLELWEKMLKEDAATTQTATTSAPLPTSGPRW